MRLLLPILLVACTSTPEDLPEIPFPDDFAWGSATAGFQVDMGCPTWSSEDCVDDASDWYQWVTAPEIVDNDRLYVSGESVDHGPGMWETFEADVALMQADGMNAYRFSLEWSRLFPTDASAATTVEELDAFANADAVSRYHEMLAAMADAGLSPMVTVNHYTLPLWVHDGLACHLDLETCPARGWVDEAIIGQISLFAGWVGKEFGGEADLWATLNEPTATTLSGYLQPGESRSAPPGLTLHAEGTVASLLNQIVAHAGMYDALHAWDTVDADGDGTAADVGVVLNLASIAARDPEREEDVAATARADHLYHRLWLDGITSGSWDDDLDGTFDRTRDDLAGRADWLGVNYYVQMTVSWIGIQPLGDAIPAFDFLPDAPWDPYPQGMYEVVSSAAETGLPIYITENGTPFVEQAPALLTAHLQSLADAMDEGADVRGYLYWSFIDNYEWNHGFDLRFGLYELDPDTKARTARPVLDRYRGIVERNGLD